MCAVDEAVCTNTALSDMKHTSSCGDIELGKLTQRVWYFCTTYGMYAVRKLDNRYKALIMCQSTQPTIRQVSAAVLAFALANVSIYKGVMKSITRATNTYRVFTQKLRKSKLTLCLLDLAPPLLSPSTVVVTPAKDAETLRAINEIIKRPGLSVQVLMG